MDRIRAIHEFEVEYFWYLERNQGKGHMQKEETIQLSSSHRRLLNVHFNPTDRTTKHTGGLRDAKTHLQRMVSRCRTRHVASLSALLPENSLRTVFPAQPHFHLTVSQTQTDVIHLEIVFVIEIGEDTSDGRQDVRPDSRSHPTRAWMRLAEAPVGFAAVRRDIWGAVSDTVGYC